MCAVQLCNSCTLNCRLSRTVAATPATPPTHGRGAVWEVSTRALAAFPKREDFCRRLGPPAPLGRVRTSALRLQRLVAHNHPSTRDGESLVMLDAEVMCVRVIFWSQRTNRGHLIGVVVCEGGHRFTGTPNLGAQTSLHNPSSLVAPPIGRRERNGQTWIRCVRRMEKCRPPPHRNLIAFARDTGDTAEQDARS